MNTPMKAVAVFDRRESAWLAEKLIDDGALDCQLVDVEEFLVDIEKFDCALQRLGGAALDIVLLDSALPSAFLTKVVLRMRDKAPGLPVLLLPQLHTQLNDTAATNESQPHHGSAATARAASGVLNAIRYARSRERLQRRLLQAALKDDLTGLHNRRGFRQLAKQHLRLARNMKQDLLLFFADLDGLKKINDEFGHRVGDQALVLAASTIKKSFRKSDVTARLGGDEFVALVMEEPSRRCEQIRSRLLGNVDKYASKESRYSLSLSVGVARIDPNTGAPLHVVLAQLMAQADAAMYSQKRLPKPITQLAAQPRVTGTHTAVLSLPVVQATHLTKRPIRGTATLATNREDVWMPASLAELAIPGIPP